MNLSIWENPLSFQTNLEHNSNSVRSGLRGACHFRCGKSKYLNHFQHLANFNFCELMLTVSMPACPANSFITFGSLDTAITKLFILVGEDAQYVGSVGSVGVSINTSLLFLITNITSLFPGVAKQNTNYREQR